MASASSVAMRVDSRRPPMVAPPTLWVTCGVADLRSEPDKRSELVDQLHAWESVAVLATRADWYYVQSHDDHYFGWIHSNWTTKAGIPSRMVVAVNLAALRHGTDESSPIVDTVPAGTSFVPAGPAVDGFECFGTGWIARDDLVEARELPSRPPVGDDFVSAARAFVDVPYRWGGTSPLGIDCSGLTQLCYRLCGVRLPRDADQQAVAGRAVDSPQAGDLAFFGEDRVTHCGVVISPTRMIHAAGGERVREDEIASRPALRGYRRYLA
jgi:hypothetical protein